MLELGVQIARGLEHAHRSGLVHRDVKPQNVLLDGAGAAKVIDFGIARSSTEVRPGLTLTGTVLGSSDYISPEQAQGRTVEERTDVYSLAIVLYELLTGELPFTGENFVAVAMRHINEEPPSVLDRRPDVPPRLAELLQRAMAKDPETAPDDVGGRAGARAMPARAAGRGGDRRPAGGSPARRARRPLELAAASRCSSGSRSARRSASTCSCTGRAASRAAAAASAVVHLRAPTAYDPDGTGGENDAAAPRATDGNPEHLLADRDATTTRRASTRPGVGLVLDAGKAVPLHRITVVTSTPGFIAEIKAGPTPDSFPDIVVGPQTVGTRRAFRPDRGLAPLLPALDHAARPAASTTPGSSRSAARS